MLLTSEDTVRLLSVRSCFGRIEAVCGWKPGATLLEASEGTELHLSSHTLDDRGDMLVFDGPRAKPAPSGLTVLPLTVPEQTGNYRIQIEPVVEDRFWASDHGYSPLILHAERLGNGDVLVVDRGRDLRCLVPARPTSFRIEGPSYGAGDSERAIEIPWVLARCRDAARVLDVGYANAEPRYIDARNAVALPFVVGIDPAANRQPGLHGVAGDALKLPFAKGSFDLVLAVSVIEHIGRVNEIYFDKKETLNENGDLDAVRALAHCLVPHGRLLITVPFGAYEDHGWFIQYDWKRLQALVAASGCSLTSIECYAAGADGWHGPVAASDLAHVQYRNGAGSAGAVACLELTAPERLRPTLPGTTNRKSENTSLADSLQDNTVRGLKLSGAWSRMHGESGPLRPVMLFCETVNICNADCVFCPYSSQSRTKGFMDPALFQSILRQYREIGGGFLTLTPMVGDALLDKHWMDRIHSISARRDFISASVTSNLYALGRYSDADVIDMLGALRKIHISCYGMTDAECQALTRRKSHGKFIEQTRRLLRLKDESGSQCQVAMGFRLASERSAADVEDFLQTQFGRMLPYGFTNTYANWGGSMRGDLPGKACWTPDRFNEGACAMLPLAIQVYWDGRVSACSCCDYDSSDQLYLGDLTRQNILEVFNGAENRAVWNSHENGNLPPICSHCTFHVPLTSINAGHPIVNHPPDFIGG